MIKTFLKYLSLYKALFKASVQADLEYRANFATRILTDIFWYLAQIITFETIFSHTEKIGDWDLSQMRVFLGILFVVDAFYMILFSDNLDRMTDKVRKGDMDLLLAKPVNSQFMMSLQRTSSALIGNLIIGLSWLSWSLANLNNLEPVRLLWLALLIPCGLICLYAIRFMFAATAVIFTKSDNLQYVWYQIYKLGMRPDSIYFPWLKFILLTVFPVSVVASVPARSVLEPANYLLFLWIPVLAFLLLKTSHRFWNFALKHYSSASS